MASRTLTKQKSRRRDGIFDGSGANIVSNSQYTPADSACQQSGQPPVQPESPPTAEDLRRQLFVLDLCLQMASDDDEWIAYWLRWMKVHQQLMQLLYGSDLEIR